jgi:hypothetical protein
MIKILKIHTVSIAIIVIMLGLIINTNIVTIANARSINEKITSIDLKTAYSIATTEALNWNKDAMSLYASSKDSHSLDLNQGSDGKRKDWTFSFVVENQESIFNVIIVDGVVQSTEEVNSGYNNELIFPIVDINISSQYAIVKAIDEFHLLPSTNWAIGYHFALIKMDNIVLIEIIGSLFSGEMKRVHFDINYGMSLAQESNSTSGSRVNERIDKTEMIVEQWVFDQNATAYVAKSGAMGASGVVMKLGMVAVHPKKFDPSISVAVKSGPIIPFGTAINLTFDGSIKLPDGKTYTQFFVQDIGQHNHQQGYSPYWIDVFFGLDSATNLQAAKDFGNHRKFSFKYKAPLDI